MRIPHDHPHDSSSHFPLCRAAALAALMAACLAGAGCNRQSAERPTTTPSSGSSGSTGTSGSSGATGTTGTTGSAMPPAADTNGSMSSGSSSSSTTSALGDTAVTAKVKAALLADSDLKSLGISVDTTDGVVTLAGGVSNQAQIDRAAQVASNVNGVRSVKNTLAIKR